ncbi:hypothetical protein ACFWXO_43720 [Kitasatospora sp. NPDC059088]|uniref:hypothetical protein n=1 Tax=Kitasatospora sp. NPDC059088 TaxID=3346722 RepID=UPI00368CE85A
MTWLLDRARTLALAGSPSARTLVIDFDGVIHDQFDGWRGGDLYGPPIPGAVEALHRYFRGGWHIAVVTARDESHHAKIRAYLEEHTGLPVVVSERRHAYWHGPEILVTNVKPGGVGYVDDNGVRFSVAAGGWATALAGLPASPNDVLRPVKEAIRESGVKDTELLLTADERTRLQVLLAGVKPAGNAVVADLTRAVADIQGHDHPNWEDLFCGNLTSWAGERAGYLLARLLLREEEVERLRAQLAELTKSPSERANDRVRTLRASGDVEGAIAAAEAFAAEQAAEVANPRL